MPFGTTVETRARTTDDREVPVLLFTGRLIQRKGVEFLVQAIPHILEQRQVKVVITGDGDRREGIAALVQKLGLESVVEMPGFVSRERLGELYAESDVYVLPAVHDDGGDTEGLGVPLIEAALHGLPIVATGIGGIVDVVNDRETGLFSPEADPEGIARAVLEVLDDPDLARSLGDAARCHARARFDWDRIIDDLLNLYESALVRGAPARPLASPSR